MIYLRLEESLFVNKEIVKQRFRWVDSNAKEVYINECSFTFLATHRMWKYNKRTTIILKKLQCDKLQMIEVGV